MTLDELPDEFEKDSPAAAILAMQLEMRRPEEQQAVISLAKGNEQKQMLLEFVSNADDATVAKFLKAARPETRPIEPTSFKDGIRSLERQQIRSAHIAETSSSPVKNPERYQEKLNDSTRAAVNVAANEPVTTKFSLVRHKSSTKVAREFLYSQYTGKCQVSGATFVQRNGVNYFEAVFIVPRLDAEYLNNPGNMLSLSAEVAAKFMHASFEWIDDIESKIQQFKGEADGGTAVDRQVRIRVAGDELVITWTEQHFMRLNSLWECAN